jgi:hypothetical protein
MRDPNVPNVPIGSTMPYIGDVLPYGWEDADGTPVTTLGSPLYGQTKPQLIVPVNAPGHNTRSHIGFSRQPRYRFIIKVASPADSPLDKIVREIFSESEVATQPERPQYVPNYDLPQKAIASHRSTWL